MDFNMRLIESMLLKGKMTTKDEISGFSSLIHGQTFHHRDIKEEVWSQEGVERIFRFLKDHVCKYDRNHSFEIEEFSNRPSKREIVFSYFPKEHVNMNLYNQPDMKGFFENFIETYATSMIEKTCEVDKFISRIKNHNKVTFRM